jgi:hypothetical protein
MLLASRMRIAFSADARFLTSVCNAAERALCSSVRLVISARTVDTVVMASNDPIALFHNAVVGEFIERGFSLGKSGSVSILGKRNYSTACQVDARNSGRVSPISKERGTRVHGYSHFHRPDCPKGSGSRAAIRLVGVVENWPSLLIASSYPNEKPSWDGLTCRRSDDSSSEFSRLVNLSYMISEGPTQRKLGVSIECLLANRAPLNSIRFNQMWRHAFKAISRY